MNNSQLIHKSALEIATRYRRCEAELIEILQQLDETKVYRLYDCTSLFQYAVKLLKLSEDTALNFISVARKAKEVPALKTQIACGSLTVSKARKMTSVLTKENQGHWLALASTLPQKKLEREVAKVNPKAAVMERASYVTGDRVKLEFGVTERLFENLKRLQDLEAQRIGKHVDMEGALEAAVEGYLDRHDPVRRADRVWAAGNETEVAGTRNEVAGSRTEVADTKTEVADTKTEVADTKTEVADTKTEVADTKTEVADTKTEVTQSKEVVARRIKSDHQTRSSQVPFRGAVRRPLRKALPARVIHAITKRDGGRCTYEFKGQRCESRRWLDLHHMIPVQMGGADTSENLATLCRAHHKMLHRYGNENHVRRQT